MRRRGEVSLSELARVLEVHEDTARSWAQRALAGEPHKLPQTSVRRDLGGKYWVDFGKVLEVWLSYGLITLVEHEALDKKRRDLTPP